MERQRLISKLSALPLGYKLTGLVVAALFLYLPNLLLRSFELKVYYGLYSVCVLAFVIFSSNVVGKKSFVAMLKMWSIGAVVYLLFAIPRIYLAGSLTPYFELTSLADRWIYSLLLPMILLGTLSVGLVFVRITSPTEFLRWGYYGLKVTLLMRALQHSAQVFNETRMALMLQNQWPEAGSRIFDVRTSWLIIKSSPLLVSTAFRNIILYWFPWGWLCLKKNLWFFTKDKTELE